MLVADERNADADKPNHLLLNFVLLLNLRLLLLVVITDKPVRI